MQKGILNGIRSLDWAFWKACLRNPVFHLSIAFLVILVFIYDLLFEILVPTRIKKEREARSAEMEREENERDKRGGKERKGPDSA